MTRLALLALALACAAAASVADTRVAGVDLRSAADRHWLLYCEMHQAQ